MRTAQTGRNLRMTETALADEEEALHTFYGVTLAENGRTLYRMPDVTTDKRRLGALLRLVRQGNVAAIHVPDIIEDFVESLAG